jgi:hypothetical protein
VRFYASIPPKKPGGVPPTLIIEATSYFDAKAYAQRMLGTDGLMFQQTGDDAVPSVELQWVGNDYAKNSARGPLRMLIRERLPDMSWGEWRPA